MINLLHTLAILGAILLALVWFLPSSTDDSSDSKKKSSKRAKKAKLPPPLTFQDFGLQPRENKSTKKSQSSCKIPAFTLTEDNDEVKKTKKSNDEVNQSSQSKGTTSDTVDEVKDQVLLDKAKSDRTAMQKKWATMSPNDKKKIIDRILSLEGTITKLDASIKQLKLKEREKMFEKNRFATADLLLAEELSDHEDTTEEDTLQNAINKAHQLEKVQALEAMITYKKGLMDKMLGRTLKIPNAQIQADLDNMKNPKTAQSNQAEPDEAGFLADTPDKSGGKWTTIKANKRPVKRQEFVTPAYSVESIPVVSENAVVEKSPSSNRRGGGHKKMKNKQPVKTIPGLNYVK